MPGRISTTPIRPGTTAGRFLYLDWVNAYRKNVTIHGPSVIQSVCGRYRTHGFRHTCTVSVSEDNRWQVVDEILPLRFLPSFFRPRPSSFQLHWLLPDWEWKIDVQESKFEIRLNSPKGRISLSISVGTTVSEDSPRVMLVRAGETVYGSGDTDPVRGWASPTYGVKVPALSLAVEIRAANDVQFLSEFNFS